MTQCPEAKSLCCVCLCVVGYVVTLNHSPPLLQRVICSTESFLFFFVILFAHSQNCHYMVKVCEHLKIISPHTLTEMVTNMN